MQPLGIPKLSGPKVVVDTVVVDTVDVDTVDVVSTVDTVNDTIDVDTVDDNVDGVMVSTAGVGIVSKVIVSTFNTVVCCIGSINIRDTLSPLRPRPNKESTFPKAIPIKNHININLQRFIL